MSTRALIGTETRGGQYVARTVHLDGYPSAVIPKLTAIVHHLHHGDQAAAVATLMASHWSSLWLPGHDGVHAVGNPSDYRDGPLTGTVTADTGSDQEWAYLFSGHRIHGYAMVNRPRYRKAFQPVHIWHVHDLPNVTDDELAAVDRAGFTVRHRAAFYATRARA